MADTTQIVASSVKRVNPACSVRMKPCANVMLLMTSQSSYAVDSVDMGVEPKIGVFTPQMDGENNGKPYENSWGAHPYFWKHPYHIANTAPIKVQWLLTIPFHEFLHRTYAGKSKPNNISQTNCPSDRLLCRFCKNFCGTF